MTEAAPEGIRDGGGPRTDAEDGPVITAQKALMRAVWHCIVDASSMNVVMSGDMVNEATRALKAAVRDEALSEVAEAVVGLHPTTLYGLTGDDSLDTFVSRSAVTAAITRLRQGESI